MSHSEHSAHGHDEVVDPHDLGHIIPLKYFHVVFGTLVVLTGFTVAVSYVDFGSHAVNMIIAMAVASVKAGLVAMIFMHLRYENPLTWLYVFFPIALLVLLLGGTFTDNPLRNHPVPMVPVGASVAPAAAEVAAPEHARSH